MANPQLVKSIGIMDGYIRNDQIRDQQLLEHIRADVALLDKFNGRTA
ncbi:MAG: hypothetical protein PVG19_08030 [Desulfobacterales bacterium]